MPHLQMFNHKIRRMDDPFDDTKAKISLNLAYEWAEKWYWWWFADNPAELEWRCVGNDIQVMIEGAWTDAIWLGSESSEWISIVRTDNYTDAYIEILNGQVNDTLFAIWEKSDLESNYGALNTEFYRVIRTNQKGRGCERMPEFTSAQLNTLREKIGNRYLKCAESWFKNHNIDAKFEMKYHADRLAEIGFDPPEHSFTKAEPIVVPVYHYESATFITDPEDTHRDEGHCECAKCHHNQQDYEEDDSCDCDNCMDNLDHWAQNGRNPDHCNFCKDFAKHLGVEEEEEED